ncbi:hypothetical protein J2Y70_003042 [Xanthomonas translucens]|nr:hypothetical protein [Xanthomonas translucens]
MPIGWPGRMLVRTRAALHKLPSNAAAHAVQAG